MTATVNRYFLRRTPTGTVSETSDNEEQDTHCSLDDSLGLSDLEESVFEDNSEEIVKSSHIQPRRFSGGEGAKAEI